MPILRQTVILCFRPSCSAIYGGAHHVFAVHWRLVDAVKRALLRVGRPARLAEVEQVLHCVVTRFAITSSHELECCRQSFLKEM